jgi:hypothetical protein
MEVQPMTDRERILAIIEGRLPDRIPWIPRLQIWYDAHRQRNDLPSPYEGWDLRKIEQDLQMGTPAREGRVFRTELDGVEVRTAEIGADMITTYTTSKGSVSTISRRSTTWSEGGIAGGLVVKHMITGPEDYPVVEEIVRRTRIIPTYSEYLAYDALVGDAGLPLVAMGPDPMYRIIQDLIGYNDAFFHLHDDRARVMHLYDVLEEQALEIQQVVLDSPATLILHGEHFDSQFTPPRLFRSTMLPYFQAFADRLHARGKVLVCHADADTSRLLELIKEAGFDMAECFVTAPMVPVTLAEARAAFDDRVIIWGGVPSSILCDPVSDAAFEAYMDDLFRTIAPGHAFILGVADNVMAEAKFDRIQRISEMVTTLGRCPIRA